MKVDYGEEKKNPLPHWGVVEPALIAPDMTHLHPHPQWTINSLLPLLLLAPPRQLVHKLFHLTDLTDVVCVCVCVYMHVCV